MPPEPASPAFEACRELLLEQAEAWNRGDLPSFLEGYHKSPETVFSSAHGSHLGWDSLRERYEQRYPDREAMGHLTFSDISFVSLGGESVLARGRWQLERRADAPRGQFIVVFRRLPEGWRIVLDYTTSES